MSIEAFPTGHAYHQHEASAEGWTIVAGSVGIVTLSFGPPLWLMVNVPEAVIRAAVTCVDAAIAAKNAESE